jgi:hypothetical protein
MTEPSELKYEPRIEALPSGDHNAEPDKLDEQRLRLTAARERIDHAAQLLARGDDSAKESACEEIRLALQDLAEQAPPSE